MRRGEQAAAQEMSEAPEVAEESAPEPDAVDTIETKPEKTREERMKELTEGWQSFAYRRWEASGMPRAHGPGADTVTKGLYDLVGATFSGICVEKSNDTVLCAKKYRALSIDGTDRPETNIYGITKKLSKDAPLCTSLFGMLLTDAHEMGYFEFGEFEPDQVPVEGGFDDFRDYCSDQADGETFHFEKLVEDKKNLMAVRKAMIEIFDGLNNGGDNVLQMSFNSNLENWAARNVPVFMLPFVEILQGPNAMTVFNFHHDKARGLRRRDDMEANKLMVIMNNRDQEITDEQMHPKTELGKFLLEKVMAPDGVKDLRERMESLGETEIRLPLLERLRAAYPEDTEFFTDMIKAKEQKEQEFGEGYAELKQITSAYNKLLDALQALRDRESKKILFGKTQKYSVRFRDDDYLAVAIPKNIDDRLELRENYSDINSLRADIGQIQVAIHHMKKRITPQDRVYLKKKGIEIPA